MAGRTATGRATIRLLATMILRQHKCYPCPMPTLYAYRGTQGHEPFEKWFNDLDVQAQIEAGNMSEVKPGGGGMSERRIHWGKGLRVYSAQAGQINIVLLGGGTKATQNRDIERAAVLTGSQEPTGEDMKQKLLGRTIGEITQARVQREPEFARGLLQEAVQALLAEQLPVARHLIRDMIKGTLGYAALSRCTGTPKRAWCECLARTATRLRPTCLPFLHICSGKAG